MYRDLLITKEKMKQICTGKGYRQRDHETSTGGNTYKDSVADDLEAFFEDSRLGRRPSTMAWTYFLPELTLHEMELVEKKDQGYFQTFQWQNNPDVDETEMNWSSSTSKYVSAYCRRKTIAIERQKSRDYTQYLKANAGGLGYFDINTTCKDIAELTTSYHGTFFVIL